MNKRQMFDKATKAANIPQCECKCRKPRIDEDDMNDIHDVNDQYVTHETAIHLQELLDEEEKPYRFLRSLIFWKNTKVYDESDKYKIQETTSMEKKINQKIETVRFYLLKCSVQSCISL